MILRPDDRPVRVNTIVVSTQHDEFVDAASEGISQEEADERMLRRALRGRHKCRL